MNVETNKAGWDREYAWPQAGDEWSEAWGGVALQWYGMILRRIFLFVPTARVLEIAPGFGRWTQFLLPLCREYTGIDLAEKCVAHCRSRFASTAHARFEVTDGRTIPLAAESVDFVFSFDSLVHCDAATVQSYLRELARALARDGIAFLHHSNVAAHAGNLEAGTKHFRDPTVSAALVARWAGELGLCCPSQETMTWGVEEPEPIDCVSLVCRHDARWARPTVAIHTDLSVERFGIRKLGLAYGPAALLGATPAPPKH